MIKKVFIIFLTMVFTAGFHFMPELSAATLGEIQGGSSGPRSSGGGYSGDSLGVPSVPGIAFDEAPAERVVSKAPEKKDPRLACLLSLIIPGSGHIYLRKDGKGIGFCAATLVTLSATGYFFYKTYQSYSDDSSDLKSKMIVSGLFFTVTAILYVISVVEAYDDADEMNRKIQYFEGSKKDNPFGSGLIE